MFVMITRARARTTRLPMLALAAAVLLPALAPQTVHAAPPCDMYCAAEAGQGAVKLAAADEFTASEGANDDTITAADGLRAAARRAYGLDQNEPRVVPSTFTAELILPHVARL
jgi:hypothetical protein